MNLGVVDIVKLPLKPMCRISFCGYFLENKNAHFKNNDVQFNEQKNLITPKTNDRYHWATGIRTNFFPSSNCI